MRVHVDGTPAPQGSKRHLGHGRMIEMSPRIKAWRATVHAAARDACRDHNPHDGPVYAHIVFRMPRPKSHYGTGRNATRIKDTAPFHPAGTPDLDKLVRGCLDALKGVCYRDDAQVVTLTARKIYADTPGADITIEAIT